MAMSEDLPSNQRAIGSYIAQADRGSSATVNIYPGPPALKNQNRQRLLAKVQAFWIKGVLEQSLYGAAVIELGLHEQPDAVTNPWRLFVEQPDQSGHLLPLGTPIKQVYDNVAGELLILGEPGSGKTTLLLQLARDLVAHAEKEETDPVPVVFNLSSWAVKQPPLKDWLVEELNQRYDVPKKTAQGWVDAEPVVYEDFLPRSAAGIFQSNLSGDGSRDNTQSAVDYDLDWLAGAIGREIHDPFALYEAQERDSLRQIATVLDLSGVPVQQKGIR